VKKLTYCYCIWDVCVALSKHQSNTITKDESLTEIQVNL
jgi:hypothetical protein